VDVAREIELERLVGVRREHDLVPIRAQDGGEPDPIRLVVVDDQDPGQARRDLAVPFGCAGFATRSAA
jgi:hypothetical protein